jgi:hypothetical protein
MDDETKAAEPRRPRRGFIIFAAHALVILLPASAIVLPMYSDDARHHIFGCTLILHRDGRIVIRTPSSRLWECDVFQYINSAYVCVLSALYVAGWMVYAVAKAFNNRKRIEPRGFPLDWPDK